MAKAVFFIFLVVPSGTRRMWRVLDRPIWTYRLQDPMESLCDMREDNAMEQKKAQYEDFCYVLFLSFFPKWPPLYQADKATCYEGISLCPFDPSFLSALHTQAGAQRNANKELFGSIVWVVRSSNMIERRPTSYMWDYRVLKPWQQLSNSSTTRRSRLTWSLHYYVLVLYPKLGNRSQDHLRIPARSQLWLLAGGSRYVAVSLGDQYHHQNFWSDEHYARSIYI